MKGSIGLIEFTGRFFFNEIINDLLQSMKVWWVDECICAWMVGRSVGHRLFDWSAGLLAGYVFGYLLIVTYRCSCLM